MSVWHEALVESVTPITPRIVSLQLTAPIAAHVPGQHVDVRLTAPDGYQAQRSYSIASAPVAGRIELAIEKLEDGEVSPFFHDVVQAGDTIELRGPLGGHFVWRPSDGGSLLLLAGGSGIVPLVAMVRAWAAEADVHAVPVLLVASARTWDDIAFRDELLRLEASHAGLRCVVAVTRGDKRRAQDLDRRLDAATLRELLLQWGHVPRHVFVCGANRFVAAVSDGLLDAGVPAAIIRTERYGGS